MKSLIKILIGTFIPVISQASPFVGEWTCTINSKSAVPLSIESLQLDAEKAALKITPALSLAYNHKGILVLNSEKMREQKDYFADDEGDPSNGMFNYIRNHDTVKLTNNILEITSLETYLRSDVNNGLEGPVVLQNKDHEVMQFEIQSAMQMEIREYSAQGKQSTPQLITVRHCLKK